MLYKFLAIVGFLLGLTAFCFVGYMYHVSSLMVYEENCKQAIQATYIKGLSDGYKRKM